MFYFNNLNKLILRVTLNLILSKILYLNFVNKKLYEEEISIRYLIKKLVIFIKIFCSKILIRYSDTITYVQRKNICKTKL